MSEKLIKFLVVVFLTLLIWGWAFVSQEQTLPKRGTLEVDPDTDPSLFVSFVVNGNYVEKVPLTALNFVGSPTKISDLRRRYSLSLDDPEREQLNFYFNPEEYGFVSSGTYTIELLEWLKKHYKTRDLALTLDSCEPDRIEVRVEELEKKRLSIECRDENNLRVPGAQIEPAQVELYVKKGYQGSAYVTLTKQLREIAQRQQHVRLFPYVELAPGRRAEATNPVSVSLEKADFLETHTFKAKGIGFIFSEEIQDKIDVRLKNEDQLRETISIRATDAAFNRYVSQTYHILIEINKSDITRNEDEYILKDIIYNFPQADVSSGEFELLESVLLERKAEVEIIKINSTAP